MISKINLELSDKGHKKLSSLFDSMYLFVNMDADVTILNS